MAEFWLALWAFMGSHMVARTRVKPFLVARIGRGGYLALYAGVSVLLLGWLLAAAQGAPRVALWPWAHGLYWVPNIFMPLAFMFLGAGFIVANPLSLVPRAAGFDPARPGFIVAVTRHPVLWGFFLWALSHLVVNGEFPLALMFFIFVLFSALGMVMVDRRRRRQMGAAAWREMVRRAPLVPFTGRGLWRGEFRLSGAEGGGIIAGLLLYGLFYAGHRWLFGFDPTPPF